MKRFKLVDRIRGDGRRDGVEDTHMGGGYPAGGLLPRAPVFGVVVDGVGFDLDGQPPPAQSKGWGDMSWLRRWRR